jgi:hypothetical protein
MEKHWEVRRSGVVPGLGSMTTMEEISFAEELDFEQVCHDLTGVKMAYLLGIAGDVHYGIESYLPFFPQLLGNDGKVTENLHDIHANGGGGGGGAHQQKKDVTDEPAKYLRARFHSRRNQMLSFQRRVSVSA